MSGLVHASRATALALSAAVSGAPRATVAVVLATTLVLGSLLPQLSLVNSEEMWLPEGPGTDSYHALASTLGSTEYVGVLAGASDGRIVTAAHFEALLALEESAIFNSTLAEAFRFPRDPDANALSVADLVAEADALLAVRRDVFEPLAEALVSTVNSTADPAAASAAVDQAAAAVALVAVIHAHHKSALGAFGHELPDEVLPELELALLSGTDPSYKADAVSLLLASVDFANWSAESGPLNPADPSLTALRSLLVSLDDHLLTNASAASKSDAIALLSRAVVAARDFLDLDPSEAPAASSVLTNLSLGFDPSSTDAAEADYANATASLARAALLIDRLSPVGDAEAASGVSSMAADLSTLLAGNASADARADGVSLFARLFEAFAAMGERGLDLNVPQTNISYDSYSVALNENATFLGSAGASPAGRAQAAHNLSLTTTGFLGNLVNLNALGIFTDQGSYERVHTMAVFLNDTFALLDAALALPDPPAALDPLASMVSTEVLHVVNTTAAPPHRFDANASAAYAGALGALEAAVRAHGGAAGAARFERAAGALLALADFEARSLASSAFEGLLEGTAASLDSSALVLEGGGPSAAKSAFAAVAQAAFRLPPAAPASAVAPASQRQLLAIVGREAAFLDSLLGAGQNPGLFARLSGATLGLLAGGLGSARGGLRGTESDLLPPLRAMLATLPGLLSSASVSNATKALAVTEGFVGADLALRHLTLEPAPPLPKDRAQAQERIRALGDVGVAATLGVLLNTTQSLPPSPASLPPGDARFEPFSAAVAAFDPGVEASLRAAFGFRARTLLPNSLTTSGGTVMAEGTVILFLFNGSLDRATLGARESALRDLAAAQGGQGVSFAAFGYGLMWSDTQRAMDLSVVLFALTMLVVMAVALWAVYRNLFDVALTIALLAFTVVWVLGTAALLRIAINPVTQIIPVLLIGLAEDYAVHLTIGYRRNRAHGAPPGRAVGMAVVGVGGVLFVATITNGVSFLSFGGSQIALIQDFGTLMALGLAYSFLLTLTLIPAATVWRDRRLSRLQAEGAAQDRPPRGTPEGGAPQAPRPRKVPGPGPLRPSASERALSRTVETCVRHPWTTLLVVALLTAASGLGATTLSTTFSYDQITARDLEVVRTLNEVQDGYPASIQRVYIVAEGKVDDPGVFLALDAAARNAADDPYVVKAGGGAGVTSIASFANDLALRIRLEGTSARGYSAGFVSAFSAADGSGDGRLGADDNLTAARLSALYGALLDDPRSTASEYVHRGTDGFDRAAVRVEAQRAVEHGDELARALEADALPLRAAALAPSLSSVTVTGLPLLNREVMQAVQDSGWQSVIATVVVALGILMAFFYAAFRSLALGPLTIAPTLIAVAWTLGAMVLAGLSLNMMTVMIATTTVGMGDLYAIHISYSFYQELKRRKDPVEAAHLMVAEAGAPLLEASATTALGFLILVFAPVPVVQSYGLIFAASIVFAFLYSILVMPILVLFLARATHQVGVEVAP